MSTFIELTEQERQRLLYLLGQTMRDRPVGGAIARGMDESIHKKLKAPPTADPRDWHDAGIEVQHAHFKLMRATTLREQAESITCLSNAMWDLQTWLPQDRVMLEGW